MMGLEAIPPEQGLRVLDRLWNAEHAQVGCLPTQWPLFMSQYPDAALLSDFRDEADERATEVSLRSILDQTPAHQRAAAVATFVAGQVAHVLGLESPADVDSEAGFFTLGMDSLTSVELKNRLQVELGCSLPATMAFDFPNVGALTRFLLTDVLTLDRQDPDEAQPEQADETSDGFDDLSEAELADLLSKNSNR